MEHYVTLFDSNYLPQGLSLHSSLERFAGKYRLWIVCMDTQSLRVLNSLRLPNVALLNVEEHLDDAMRRARSQRTVGEFCWTMTPHVYDFVFGSDASIDRLTYLDADVWFRRSPRRIFQELESSGKRVLITDHGYAAEYDQSATSGQFCVQFLTFYRHGSEDVRRKWQSQTLAWCYNRVEDGKFGDQKYLDEWPDAYEQSVHVLRDQHLMLAPWNASRFPYGNSVLWHFHGLKLTRNQDGQSYNLNIGAGFYAIPNVVQENVYKPYIQDLNGAISKMNSLL
jgi:hypothetical protein